MTVLDSERELKTRDGGWESQVVVYATTAGVTISRLVDVLQTAHELKRFTRCGKKAVRSRSTP